MSKYCFINEFLKILGVSVQILRNWNNKSKRVNKTRNLVEELIEKGGEDNDKNCSSNVGPK